MLAQRRIAKQFFSASDLAKAWTPLETKLSSGVVMRCWSLKAAFDKSLFVNSGVPLWNMPTSHSSKADLALA